MLIWIACGVALVIVGLMALAVLTLALTRSIESPARALVESC